LDCRRRGHAGFLFDHFVGTKQDRLVPGQRHDSIGVAPLITDIAFAALIADKAASCSMARKGRRGVRLFF
jgi:hypothetical protein